MMGTALWLWLSIGCVSVVPPAQASPKEPVVVVRAAELHVGDGRVIQGGMLIVEDGDVVAIGADLEIPAGALVIEVEGGSITPGLIDANARIEPRDFETPREPEA